MDAISEPPKKSWFGRNWLWLIPVVLSIPCLCCGGGGASLIFGVMGALKSAEPYTESLARAQKNLEVQHALGTPIEAGFGVTGNISVNGSSGHAKVEYSISGSQGSATVTCIASKQAGTWNYSTMKVVIDGTGESIDLLAAASHAHEE